ncbi:MAG TPA: hypothetical protein VMN76_02255 [Acidobacteriota bacterium]|nr:hypothetical protein [Acidobacteriota bacterium]
MNQPQNLLIVSDLHLSEGRHPITRRISRTEDFFFDEEFASFLQYHLDVERWGRREWTLVINGDCFDLLQVTSLPEEAAPFDRDRRYGLRIGPAETAWKIRLVMRGHDRFFQTLAEFAARFKIVVVLGNHDIELIHREAQQAFIDELQRLVPHRLRSAISDRVSFHPWFFFDGVTYVEHGHQYDPHNCFRSPLRPFLPGQSSGAGGEDAEIDLPLGSLFVRYLFNLVEEEFPFADNIKPATRFLRWFLRHHPMRAYGFLMTDGRQMLRRMKRNWKQASQGGDAAAPVEADGLLQEFLERLNRSLHPPFKLEALRELDRLKAVSIMRRPPGFRWKLFRLLCGPFLLPAVVTVFLLLFLAGAAILAIPLLQPAVPPAWLAQLADSSAGFSPAAREAAEELRRFILSLFLLQAALLCGFFLKKPRTDASKNTLQLRATASAIQRLTRARYVVMGHTHDPDLRQLDDDAIYFNTGSWTKVFSEEERIIREEKEFLFLRILAEPSGRTRARLLKWEGGGEPTRLANLFDYRRES